VCVFGVWVCMYVCVCVCVGTCVRGLSIQVGLWVLCCGERANAGVFILRKKKKKKQRFSCKLEATLGGGGEDRGE